MYDIKLKDILAAVVLCFGIVFFICVLTLFMNSHGSEDDLVAMPNSDHVTIIIEFIDLKDDMLKSEIIEVAPNSNYKFQPNATIRIVDFTVSNPK